MAVLNYSQVMKKYGTKNYSELRKKMQAEGEAPEWFTTGGAQLFFEKYSWEGETVKSRLKSIAKDLARKAPTTYPTWWNVDTYCAGKTWEEVFFQVLWDGYISCSTPLLANGGLPERGTTVSCLTGDALINTKHGGLKRMEDIEIGDEVLTHKGRWKKVINKMSRMSDGDLYQMTVRTRKTKTKITGNHPVLTQEGWVNVEDLTPQHLIAVNKELTEVVEQDFTMSFDNSVLVKPSVGKPIEDVEVDGDLAWALGLWFAEGSLNRMLDSNGHTHGRSVRITMASHEECHVQRFLQIMKDKLGVDGKCHHSEFEGRTWVTGQISSKVVAEYFGKNFGIGCKTKVVPRWVIDLPKEKLQQFLNGFYCGDGRKPNGDRYSTPDIRIHNQQLLAQLYEIAAKLGYTTSLLFDDNKVGTPRGSLVFCGCSDFGFPEKVVVRKYPSDGINQFHKFNLEKLDTDELVYDITVEDDHSFSVAGVVVHNCAGGYVGDDLYSRYDVVTESAILTKHSHGTSCSVDDWAYKGKPLPRGGFAGGVMPLIRDLITCMDEVVQGSRRGSLSYALSIEHPEWYEVLNYLYKNPESNNPAWLVKDEFVNKLESLNPQDYVDALTRLGKAVEVKMMRGKGYFTKIDEMNRHLAQAFKDAGMTVKASNLCVAPETLILTRNGYEVISELAGQQVEVWNGAEWSEVTVVKTGENQKLVTVKTDFGYELDCTEYHRFMVIGEDGEPQIKRAFELKAGDKLSKFDLPVIAGSVELENAYTNGFHTGDGTMAGGTQVTYLYGEKVKLLEHIEDVKKAVDEGYRVRITHNGNLKDKFFVPDSKYTVQSRLDWLAGILDADGCVARNGANESFQLVSVDQNFLKEVQLMLQTLGVTSKVVHHLDAGMKPMPLNDGTGEYGDFQCKDAYRLLISSTGLFKLSLLGLKTNRLFWSERKPQRCAERFITVSEVVDNGRYDDTYCATEPKRNMLMFNGLNTMNCQETNLGADEDHTFSCVILNWNLDHYREAMAKCPHIGFIAHVMQDCNVSVYIEAIKKRKQEGKRDAKALEKILRFTEKFRAVGTGVLGLHTLFQKESIVVGSIESFQLNNKIFKYLDQETLAASKWLAQELGCPEGTKHLGIRNATRMMMPPTKSTAEFMAGASEGIGLDVAMVYTKQSAGGELVRVNKVLLPIMKERGVFNEATLMDLSMKKGSVQHVDWLTDHEKAVFRTAFEIDMEAHLKLCSQRQQYIDQGQSINLYFTSNDSHEYIMDIHRKALLDPNILTLYYVYSMRGSGEIKREVGCEVCQ